MWHEFRPVASRLLFLTRDRPEFDDRCSVECSWFVGKFITGRLCKIYIAVIVSCQVRSILTFGVRNSATLTVARIAEDQVKGRAAVETGEWNWKSDIFEELQLVFKSWLVTGWPHEFAGIADTTDAKIEPNSYSITDGSYVSQYQIGFGDESGV